MNNLNTVSPIKIGVIGAGVMSQKTHLPILKDLASEGLINLVVLCDLNFEVAKKASEDFGFSNSIHDADKVFEFDIDALYVFGTAQLHHKYALKALKNGVHVFIEKPPAPNIELFAELAAEAKQRNLIGAVGLNRRFQKNITQISKEVAGVGLYAMEASFHKPVVKEQPPHGAKTWLPINAIHSIDVLLYLKGELPETIASAANTAKGDALQNFSALLTWSDGTHATISSDYSAGSRMERYTVHGYDTSYEITLTGTPTFSLSKNGKTETVDEDNTFTFRGFTGEHRAFVDAIKTGVEPIHSFGRCIDTVFVTELIENNFSGQVPELPGSVSSQFEDATSENSILVLNPTGVKDQLPRLKEHFNLVFADEMDSLENKVKNSVKGMLTGPGGVQFDAALLSQFPNIEIAGIIGASLKSYNTELLYEKGISICNASDAYAESVAEFMLMQAIAGVREATRSHDLMRSGGWGVSSTKKQSAMMRLRKMINKPLFAPLKKVLHPFWKNSGMARPMPSSRPSLEKDFRGSTVGIVGLGEITKKLIPHLKHFGCEILICSEYMSEQQAAQLGVKKATLDQVLQSDVIALLRGLSERTVGSFGEAEFKAIKNGAVFINAARAGIVDEQALVKALKEKRFFACLDVFHKEPLAKDSVLRSLPNVFLTSHIAACSLQLRSESVTTVVNKLISYMGDTLSQDDMLSAERLKNMT